MNVLKKIFSVASIAALTLSVTQGAQATVELDEVKEQSTVLESKTEEVVERKIVGYFPEWAYESKEHNYFNVTDLQWESLTHIQYSFAMVDPDTNKITFGDEHAAIKEDFEGYDLSYNGEEILLDDSLSYQGHFNVLQQMKKKFPDVKLLISVGGWAGSRGFYTMMDTDEGIQTFVDSAVQFIRDYGFDGVDIDFEFPSSTSQSGNPEDFDVSEPRRDTINARYNVMIEKLREGIDKAGQEDGKDYLLTAAVSASSWVLGGVESNDYADHLDFLSIMSYDFHGGWNEFVENQANIYPDPEDRETANMLMPVLGADWAYKYYRGVLPPEKILMGIPYYTRGWENVQGGNGTGLHGSSNTPATGKYNIWGDPDEDGNIIPAGANPLWHVLNLMDQDPDLQVHWDEVGKVPYVWHNDEKVFLSFENEQSIDERLKYIEENNLGGALIWVMNGDYGLNPNYVEGSTDISEGKYTVGDTLTTQLSEGLKEMGPASVTDESNSHLEKINVDVELKGSYDHPNYTYDFIITNNTEETIQGGWELAFDLPKSAQFKSSWGGTVTQEDNGDFTRITIKSSGWQTLEPGATANLQGMIGLCFSDVRNITFNGYRVDGEDAVVNAAPVLSGVSNKTITVGDLFSALEGVSASDKEDGDLTAKIKVEGVVDVETAGTYELTYSVSDSQGLTTSVKRIITVMEPLPNQAPTLNGVEDITIYVGEAFNPLKNITATDDKDGDLTAQIKVEGTVNVNVAGRYELTYKVSDSEGLTTSKTRVVTVVREPNQAPVLSGIQEITINVGDVFDALAGIQAMDKEDGDLTAQIKVEGTVDVNVAGRYELTYKVTDSDGVTTTAVRIITVKETTSDTFDLSKVYNTGDTVVYKGDTYTAKWWVQGQYPDQSDAWEKVVAPNEDGSINYEPGMVFTGGQLAKYDGHVYRAKWWTNTVPGSDSSWEFVR
ncbi:MAG TPA: chitinase [Firmicutes bacterium]|nr:chitinase [Bacillota bacterium]